MTTPVLLSERVDPAAGGRWVDCAWASAVMLARKRGQHFPLGYTWNEREALERACSRPAETGANVADIDVATQHRYGWTFARVTDLHAALRGKATVGLMVAGNMHVMPTVQKRWDPAFGARDPASHMVYVEPTGDGIHVRWLDPEAVDGFAGDIVDAATVERFNAGYGPENTRMATEAAAPGFRLNIEHGATVHYSKFSGGKYVVPDRSAVWTDPTRNFACSATAQRPTTHGDLITVAKAFSGHYAGWWIHLGPGVTVRPA